MSDELRPISPVVQELIKDIQARDRKGWETYGRPMAPNDGQNSLQDAIEECIDLCLYLKKALMEKSGGQLAAPGGSDEE